MQSPPDPRAQLPALYRALLSSRDRFVEFSDLLRRYDFDLREGDEEPQPAAALRQTLNLRLVSWVSGFQGLSIAQTLQWRAIVVEEKFNRSGARPRPPSPSNDSRAHP